MKWISLKHKLPPLYDFVLVHANNLGTGEPKPIAIARKVRDDGPWDFLGGLESGAWMDIEYDLTSDDITHWMEMPECVEGYHGR